MATTTKAIDKQWFMDQLAKRGRSLRDLAVRIGIDPSALSRALNGERKLKIEEAEKIARFLETTVEDVLRHMGMPIEAHGGRHRIALTANINEAGKIEKLKDEMPLPESVLVRAQAAVVGDYTLLSAAQVRARKGALSIWDDAVLLFEETNAVEPEAVGVLSVVTLRDGVQMIGHLDKARKTGEATLRTPSGETKEVVLQSAAPVLAVVP